MSERLPEDEPGLPDFDDVIRRAQLDAQRAGTAPPDAPAAGPTDGQSPVAAAEAATTGPARLAPVRDLVTGASLAAPAPVAPSPPAAPAEAGPAKPLSPTRAMAVYLTKLRQLLAEASESRRSWVRQIGIMMQDARTRPLAMVSPAAGKIGSEQMSRFGELRDRLHKLEPPQSCADLQNIFHSWLDRHMEVCQMLIDFGRNGELAKLKASQSLLAEGRADLQRFQAAYSKQVAGLKRQVDSAKKRRRTKWPFGGPKPA